MDPWSFLPGIGAGISGFFNSQAADQANEGARAGAALKQKYLEQGQQQLGAVAADNSQGQQYLHQVVAGSGDLTPAQQLALADIRRNEGNQIRSSALAGSGRASAALMNDTENRFTIGALDTNRQRADNAASGMANRGFQAQTQSASMSPQIGNALGGAEEQIGRNNSNATTATGKAFGQAFGTISSEIGRSNKQNFSNVTAGDKWGDNGTITG